MVRVVLIHRGVWRIHRLVAGAREAGEACISCPAAPWDLSIHKYLLWASPAPFLSFPLSPAVGFSAWPQPTDQSPGAFWVFLAATHAAFLLLQQFFDLPASPQPPHSEKMSSTHHGATHQALSHLILEQLEENTQGAAESLPPPPAQDLVTFLISGGPTATRARSPGH